MTRNDLPEPVAPLLEYSSAPLSPYDRPIEPFVTFARRFRLAIRIAYVAAIGIGAILFLGYVVMRFAGMVDR